MRVVTLGFCTALAGDAREVGDGQVAARACTAREEFVDEARGWFALVTLEITVLPCSTESVKFAVGWKRTTHG